MVRTLDEVGLPKGAPEFPILKCSRTQTVYAAQDEAGQVVGQSLDRRDAFEICDGVYQGIYTSIEYIPDAKVLCLPQIPSHRRHFVKICTMEINAPTYIAGLGTPNRFGDSGPVVSYIGLVPSNFDTRAIQRHGHITKRGSGGSRAVLCEAVQHAA